ncbi:hypothetical protein [Microscilla marina]|uniref:Uncharacterized protein n=1 Tax=Microscilla marina ATCC 23134 TaxID=313606 RepID=A1ZYR1_MICM2|nr:hypothetical protein [Microscilla marina]EAY24485.1 hypothetical protein M23134_06472 [Microscilla marina ATCC 23134]
MSEQSLPENFKKIFNRAKHYKSAPLWVFSGWYLPVALTIDGIDNLYSKPFSAEKIILTKKQE